MSDLNKRLTEYEDMKSEIEDLRKFIGIKEENDDFILSPPCSVISRVANDPYGALLLTEALRTVFHFMIRLLPQKGL